MNHCLEIDDVLFEINNKTILSSIYLQIKTNTINGLLGRNGAGKSTLMKIIFGILDCQNSIRIDNISIKFLKNKNKIISYLPQFNFIPKSLTIYQVLYYFDLDSKLLESTIKDFENITKMKFGQLSGGHRRIIELYVILFSNSKFALLDEPFSQLSPIQIESAKKLIIQAKKQKGILITDHFYTHILDITDKNYVLKDGRSYLIDTMLDLEKFGYLNQK